MGECYGSNSCSFAENQWTACRTRCSIEPFGANNHQPSNVNTNIQASQSRIQNADFAIETSALTKLQILSQAAIAMLAQANAFKQSVLSLL